MLIFTNLFGNFLTTDSAKSISANTPESRLYFEKMNLKAFEHIPLQTRNKCKINFDCGHALLDFSVQAILGAFV